VGGAEELLGSCPTTSLSPLGSYHETSMVLIRCGLLSCPSRPGCRMQKPSAGCPIACVAGLSSLVSFLLCDRIIGSWHLWLALSLHIQNKLSARTFTVKSLPWLWPCSPLLVFMCELPRCSAAWEEHHSFTSLLFPYCKLHLCIFSNECFHLHLHKLIGLFTVLPCFLFWFGF
jgi:hypothetical protein